MRFRLGFESRSECNERGGVARRAERERVTESHTLRQCYNSIMSENINKPKVGLGVVIINKEGKVLIGKRKGSHAQKYSIPGGHLELGETFEEGTIREVKEEADLDIINPKVIGVTNNLETYREENKHYISVILLVENYTGELKNVEPDKCEEWVWCDPKNLPQPHFDASRLGIECYVKKVPYCGIK